MANPRLPRTAFIVNEDLENRDLIDDNVEAQVNLIHKQVDPGRAEEALA